MRPSIQSLVRAQSVDWEPQAPKPEASERSKWWVGCGKASKQSRDIQRNTGWICS